MVMVFSSQAMHLRSSSFAGQTGNSAIKLLRATSARTHGWGRPVFGTSGSLPK